MINKKVAQNIKNQRLSQNLSQGDLAQVLHVDRSYVSALESGTRNPSLETLSKIARALQIPVNELLGTSSYEAEKRVPMPIVSGLIKDKEAEWKDKQWYHQRFDGSPYLIYMIAEAEIVTRRDQKYGLYFDKHFCFFEDGKADWYIDIAEIERITNLMLNEGKKDPNFSKTLIEQYKPLEDAFYSFCKYIDNQHLYKFSDSELIELHDQFLQSILDRNSSSSIIDGFALGTDRLLESKLQNAYNNHPAVSKRIQFSELFSILTTPNAYSFVQEAELRLFELILSIQASPADRKRLIKEYRDKFYWIKNNYVDSYNLPVSYFDDEIARIESSALDLQEEISRIKAFPITHKKEKEDLLKELSLDTETLFLLKVTEDFTHWQDERKKATLFTAHYSTILLDEISRRTRISTDLLKYMTPREVSTIFSDTPPTSVLEDRRKQSVIYWNVDGHEVLSGPEVSKIQHAVLGDKDISDVQDFRGMTASRGKAEGYVKIIKSVKEIDRLNAGDVLVTVMTRPDYVPAMKKAIAIVTDEGGITSHAAIVSRELKIPCIIGTKIATHVLREGDYVQVNANHGVVRILRRI